MIRSAPDRFMSGAPTCSRSVTFSSLAASFSSVAASHCCRWPSSYQTARQRPCSSRVGYTVMPYSSSMTSPPPRVAARPVPFARTRPATRRPALTRSGLPRASCGDFDDRGRCPRHGIPSLPAFPQAGGLTVTARFGSRDRTRTYNLPVNSRTLCRLSYAGSTRIRVAHLRRTRDAHGLWRPVLFGARPDEYHRVMGEGHVCT